MGQVNEALEDEPELMNAEAHGKSLLLWRCLACVSIWRAIFVSSIEHSNCFLAGGVRGYLAAVACTRAAYMLYRHGALPHLVSPDCLPSGTWQPRG